MGVSEVQKVKARKKHLCSACGWVIDKGATYLSWTCFFDGDPPVDSKVHSLCFEIEALGYKKGSKKTLGLDEEYNEYNEDYGREEWAELVGVYGPEGWKELNRWSMSYGLKGNLEPPVLHDWLVGLEIGNWSEGLEETL